MENDLENTLSAPVLCDGRTNGYLPCSKTSIEHKNLEPVLGLRHDFGVDRLQRRAQLQPSNPIGSGNLITQEKRPVTRPHIGVILVRADGKRTGLVLGIDGELHDFSSRCGVVQVAHGRHACGECGLREAAGLTGCGDYCAAQQLENGHGRLVIDVGKARGKDKMLSGSLRQLIRC